MARKPPLGRTYGSTATLISSGKLITARLLKITSDGKIDSATKDSVAPFLLNPSSIKENKTTNWVQHSVPGQSDPVMQWVNGGPRTVTFEALVTKDTSYAPYADPKSGGPLADLANSAINAVGGIASKFAGVNIPLGDIIGAFIPNQDGAGEELSIANWLNYYRSLMYPTYTGDGVLQQSPPLLLLEFGRALSARKSGPAISANDTVYVLTDLEINITKFLPNLTPMEATVTFTMVEYIIAPKGVGSFGITQEAGKSSANTLANKVADFLGL